MTTPGSNDDCYFYFYSSCTKGDSCPFRHCEAALGTETVCSVWRQGRCYRSNCKFRHMESRINRATIPCYWENQPGGCRKPHCVFLHKKSRSSIHEVSEIQELILPVSANNTANSNKTITKDQPVVKDQLKATLTKVTENENALDLSNISETSSSQPVPFVVSFDEGEESDTESVSSTPIKSASSEFKVIPPDSAKINLISLFEKTEEKDFGVKTLEQLRMEKIHRESEHFYKSDDTTGKDIASKTLDVNRNPLLNDTMFNYSAYDAPVIDSSHVIDPDAMYKQESYPPESEFISISVDTSTDKPNSTAENDSMSLSEHDRDLRGRLLKRRAMSSFPEKDVPAKRVISLRKEINQAENPLDFKIKTLDEIRKERENKQGNQEEGTFVESVQERNFTLDMPTSSTEIINSTFLSGLQKPLGKPKIKRQPKESYIRNNSLLVNMTNGDVKSDNRSQMVLHEVQNISEDQNKSSKLLTDEKQITFTKVSGKRKNDECMTDKNNKILKADSSVLTSSTFSSLHIANEVPKNVKSDDSSSKRLQHPVICKNNAILPLKNESTKNVTSDVKESTHDNLDLQYNETNLTSDEVTSSKDGVCSVTSTTTEVKESESRTVRSLSVDEFDHLFLHDGDVNLDDVEDSADGGAEELLLEFKQLLES